MYPLASCYLLPCYLVHVPLAIWLGPKGLHTHSLAIRPGDSTSLSHPLIALPIRLPRAIGYPGLPFFIRVFRVIRGFLLSAFRIPLPAFRLLFSAFRSLATYSVAHSAFVFRPPPFVSPARAIIGKLLRR